MPTNNLKIINATPNPNSEQDKQLFLFVGDVTQQPIQNLIPDEGVSLPPSIVPTLERPFRLRILHVNDMHGHISRFTRYGNRPIFSKIVWRIRQVQAKCRRNPNRGLLTLSAGDDLIGSVFDELLGDDPHSYKLHASYHLYSAAGFDAVAPGNHDLDMGTALLAQALRQDAAFPMLAANLTGSRYLQGLYYPAALFVVKGIRVGVIGLITPASTRLQHDTSLQIVNPLQAIHNLLPALRPICDVLIIVSHLGYSLDAGGASVREAGDVELARSLPPGCVELIVGGHTHHALNEQGLSAHNIVNDIPIVQAGTLGRFLGEVDITVQRTAAVTNVRLTATADLPIDKEFEEKEVQPLVNQVRPIFAQTLGQVDHHPDLTTDAVQNAFASGESALVNFITDALVTRCRGNGHNVNFAAIDNSVVRCGLPETEMLTFGDWFNLMPFADTIRLYWLTGGQLRDLLQDNARRIDRPGEPHTERGFLHFSRQLHYKIDLGQNLRQAQAFDVEVEGLPLAEQLGRSFLVATSSFVRQASLPWERYVRQVVNLSLVDIHAWPRLDTPLFLRDELIAYIRAQGGVTMQTGAQRDQRLEVVWPADYFQGVKNYVNRA